MGPMSGWIATFDDGPLAAVGQEHVFVVGEPWAEIAFAPMPASAMQPRHWIIVDGTGLAPRDESVPPWPGQVTYRLERVEVGAGAEGDAIAVYRSEAA